MSEANVATTGKAGTDHGLQGDVQRLGQHVGQLHEDLARIAKGAGEVAHSGVAAAKQSGKNTFETAKDKSALAAASLRNSISSHPGTALGIAVGVGILIGLVAPAIARSRRSAS
jgi:ElaB/YqjD/DUF883 family membrane-anchored ribosome-binding protein